MNQGKILIYSYTSGDPLNGTFEATTASDPVVGRKSADLNDWVLLNNGKVLITGGADVAGAGANIAVLFDPTADGDAVTAGTFAATGAMNVPRKSGICVTLGDGKILIIGGQDADDILVAASEEYDPAANTWATVGGLNVPRSNFGFSVLSDGRVAVFGGADADGNVLDSIEIYDPSTDTWEDGGTMITARERHRAVLLADNRVLIIGGKDALENAIQEAESYTIPE